MHRRAAAGIVAPGVLGVHAKHLLVGAPQKMAYFKAHPCIRDKRKDVTESAKPCFLLFHSS